MSSALNCLLQTSCLGSIITQKEYFYYCLPVFTAMLPFIYDTVLLWLCKWQLTGWVGVNAVVYSVAIGERRKQVVNNISKLLSSIAYCFKNDIYESTGCNLRTYKV